MQVAADDMTEGKSRNATAMICLQKGHLSQVQESITGREEDQEIRRGRKKKESERNFYHQKARSKEEQLTLKLAKLTEEYNKLKKKMVSTAYHVF